MLDEKFNQHLTFKQLDEYAEFYETLSTSILGIIPFGVTLPFNIDSYLFTSIQGSILSIKEVLLKGRFSDAYALLRKYYDSVYINIYTNLFLEDNITLENLFKNKIDDWVHGKEQLPRYESMRKYIEESKKLANITNILKMDDPYKIIRDRCNDFTHYNFYRNILYNDSGIYLENRLGVLDQFGKDICNIFILHFSYLFTLSQHYMVSSDYIDSLDMGLTPEEGSEYFVAPFIQKMFDDVIKKYRIDLANEIKKNTSMKLE